LSPLAEGLERRIAAEGPITIAAFMAEALMHPTHGYYTKSDPFGVDGDFTTAPEISQIFGELIGLWCADVWRQLGAPEEIALAELGPGRGTLMADALRASAVLPAFREAVSVHLVEASPFLRSRQAQALAAFSPTWHETAASLPDVPTLLIANEFFDALPIHQFVFTPNGWRERLVTSVDGVFAVIVSPQATPRERLIDGVVSANAQVGNIAEVCPAALSIMEAMSAKLAQHGGAALIVDYGSVESQARPTLQSVRNHKAHDFLEAPGSADITAHVDFAALVRAAGPQVQCWGPISQADFLSRLGLAERAARLAANATESQIKDIETACHRLIAAEEMGNLFKALAVTVGGTIVPPAFEECTGFNEK